MPEARNTAPCKHLSRDNGWPDRNPTHLCSEPLRHLPTANIASLEPSTTCFSCGTETAPSSHQQSCLSTSIFLCHVHTWAPNRFSRRRVWISLTLFWEVTPWSLVDTDRRLRSVCCKHLRNVGQFLRDYVAQYLRRQSSSWGEDTTRRTWLYWSAYITAAISHQSTTVYTSAATVCYFFESLQPLAVSIYSYSLYQHTATRRINIQPLAVSIYSHSSYQSKATRRINIQLLAVSIYNYSPYQSLQPLGVSIFSHSLYQYSATRRINIQLLAVSIYSHSPYKSLQPLVVSIYSHPPAEQRRFLHQDVEVVLAAHLAVPLVHRAFKATGSFAGHLQHKMWDTDHNSATQDARHRSQLCQPLLNKWRH
jgi:hypothetical protein